MITSNANPKIKEVVHLLTSTKERREQRSYVIEGIKMFREAPASQMRQVFMTRDGYEKVRAHRPEIASLVTDGTMQNLKGPFCEMVSDEVFAHMCDTKTPQGVLCVMAMPQNSLTDLVDLDADELTILVLEGIQDPGNLGSMVRSGEAAGVDLILADRGCTDLYHPKVIRSTMGAIFRVPFFYSDNLYKSLGRLRERDVTLYAAHLRGKRSFWDVSYAPRSAFLIGNEGNGLSDEAARMADQLVKIPMEGEAESLNAAVAASLMLFERKRQFKLP